MYMLRQEIFAAFSFSSFFLTIFEYREILISRFTQNTTFRSILISQSDQNTIAEN